MDIWKDAYDRLHANLRKRAEDVGEIWRKLNAQLQAATTEEGRAPLRRRLENIGCECHELNSIVGTANSLKNWANAQVAKGNGP